MAFVQHEDNLSFHILHQWKPKDLKKADHKSLCEEEKCYRHWMNHCIKCQCS